MGCSRQVAWWPRVAIQCYVRVVQLEGKCGGPGHIRPHKEESRVARDPDVEDVISEEKDVMHRNARGSRSGEKLGFV